MGKARDTAQEGPTLDVGGVEDPVPVVTGANGRQRKPIQGDEARPRCVRCSTEGHPVLMAALSTREYYTYYQCPTCGDRTKIARYSALQRLGRRPPVEDHSAR